MREEEAGTRNGVGWRNREEVSETCWQRTRRSFLGVPWGAALRKLRLVRRRYVSGASTRFLHPTPSSLNRISVIRLYLSWCYNTFVRKLFVIVLRYPYMTFMYYTTKNNCCNTFPATFQASKDTVVAFLNCEGQVRGENSLCFFLLTWWTFSLLLQLRRYLT